MNLPTLLNAYESNKQIAKTIEQSAVKLLENSEGQPLEERIELFCKIAHILPVGGMPDGDEFEELTNYTDHHYRGATVNYADEMKWSVDSDDEEKINRVWEYILSEGCGSFEFDW